MLISWQIFESCLVLTNTKPLPFGHCQNTIGVLLVNLSNIIGMLLVKRSNYEMLHATLYESFTKDMPPDFHRAPLASGGFLIIG
jgi:hypothetical protein